MVRVNIEVQGSAPFSRIYSRRVQSSRAPLNYIEVAGCSLNKVDEYVSFKMTRRTTHRA